MAEQTPEFLVLADSVLLSDDELNEAVESKKYSESEMEDAVLSYAARKDLPDSAFCLVKDEDGKKIRKFPAHDAAHVRNGLARLSQSSLSTEDKAKVLACLKGRAKKYGIKVSESEDTIQVEDIKLSEAVLEDINSLQIFEDFIVEHDKQFATDRVESLLVALERSDKESKDLKAKIESLESQVADTDQRINSLTSENADLLATIHKNLADKVVEVKLQLKTPDAKKFYELSGDEKKAFKDTLITDHQQRTTESLNDTLKDLQPGLYDQAPVSTPTEGVDNPGLSVKDSDQTNTGVTKKVKGANKASISRSNKRDVKEIFGLTKVR